MTFEERKRLAEDELRAGYDPESENVQARRSDAFGAALGWQDAIAEEAMTRSDSHRMVARPDRWHLALAWWGLRRTNA